MTESNILQGAHAILAASIVLGAILISLSLVYSGTNISNELAKIRISSASSPPPSDSKQAPSPSDNLPKVPQQPTDSTPPSGQGVVLTYDAMKSLLPKAAATLGSKDAKVIMFEFSDYQCPFCRRHFNFVYPDIKKNYIDTGKVLLAFFDYPLSFHPAAFPSAKAARCAGEQGKYWEAHDAIFTGQGTGGSTVQYSEEQLKEWISKLPGLNVSAFNSCFSSNKYDSYINENAALGQSLGIFGTPGFIINGKIISGAYPYETFDSAIKESLGS
ncbi:MAG: thioredoxin domain-containing protein [Candidatus Anstonellales archaeon]